MNNSFRPCNTCSMQCEKAKSPSKSLSAIEREIQKEDIKKNGCPYLRKSK